MLYDEIKPRLRVYNGVYRPLEDSRMLGRSVEKHAFGKMLDLGTGTGIQGIIGARKGCDVTFADFNPGAVECARENASINGVKGDFVVSDLFSNIHEKFNTISFDPPYLKSRSLKTGKANVSTDGGANGREVIDRFLADYKKYVLEEHVVLMVESWWNGFKKDIKAFDMEIVERLHYPLLGDCVVLKFR